MTKRGAFETRKYTTPFRPLSLGLAIFLGPNPFEASDPPGRYRSAVDLSFCSMGSGLWNRTQGNLLDPDGIRSFVLDALGLPEDDL